MAHISVLLMVKDEAKRLTVTLESLKNHVNSIVMYDTGSTDDTIDIAKKYCKDNGLSLRLKEGVFVDFEVSRNEALTFAYSFPDIDFILLMDVNDELRGGENLREFCNNELNRNGPTAFLLFQEWFSGGVSTVYYNIRLIKARKNWFYRGVVHEYITRLKINNEPVDNMYDKTGKLNYENMKIKLYQNRDEDGGKSQKRYTRDKELLLNSYKKDPTNARTVFYLAQTYECLGEKEDAVNFYKIRTNMGGFMEEVFHSFMRMGNILKSLEKSWYDEVMPNYMKAFETLPRAEPLVCIAEYYRSIKNWKLAFMFLSMACDLEFPKDCVLFIDKSIYDYKRWHLMGIIGYYADKMQEGRNGCIKALEYNPYSKIDKSNLNFY